MKVSNDDINAITFAIAKLQRFINMSQNYEESLEATHQRKLLIVLKEKIIIEFSQNVFPELKGPH